MRVQSTPSVTLIWTGCLFAAILKPYDLKGVDATIAWVMASFILLMTAVVIVWLNRKLDETTDEIASETNENED